MTNPTELRSFEEFWPHYVAAHRSATSRWLHFTGTGLTLLCLAASPFYPWLLLAAPAIGYGFAWAGHFLFEHNQPATFGHALWSLRGDLRMFRLMATGRMRQELGRWS